MTTLEDVRSQTIEILTDRGYELQAIDDEAISVFTQGNYERCIVVDFTNWSYLEDEDDSCLIGLHSYISEIDDYESECTKALPSDNEMLPEYLRILQHVNRETLIGRAEYLGDGTMVVHDEVIVQKQVEEIPFISALEHLAEFSASLEDELREALVSTSAFPDELAAEIPQASGSGQAENEQPSYYGKRPNPAGFGPLTRKLEAASETQTFYKQGDELHDDPPVGGSYQILDVTTVSTADDRRQDMEREALMEGTSNVLASAVVDGLLDEELATLIDHTLVPAMLSAFFADSDGSMPHSASKPAIVLREEDTSPVLECWLYAGELHRENGPAVVRYWSDRKGMDRLHYLANTEVAPGGQMGEQSAETRKLARWSS